MSSTGPLSTPRDTDDLLRTLQKREEWFRAVFEGSAMGIAVVDMRGHFIDANAAFLRMVGRTADELRGLSLEELDHPDDHPREESSFRRMVEGEIAHYQLEKRYVRRDGTALPVKLPASVVRDAHGQPRFCAALVGVGA